MSDKDPKLWESTFGDDSDAEKPEKLSRVRRKKSRHSNTLLVWVIALVLLAIMFSPIIHSAISANHQKSAVDTASQVSVSSKPKKAPSKAKKQTHKKQKAKQVTSKLDDYKNQEKTPTANDNPPAPAKPAEQPQNNNDDSQKQAADANNNAAANTNQTQQQDSGEYYTVQPKDNAYRIALNHGMTTAQLYQLNGISTGTVLHPGMRLKVK
ncbi:LysM peptidoglycan-binding domain-containing protein [Bombilactobacillus bombi]|uniref:LysM peptidoglycan-binding domain-containing protein n=1 Tax=Bombilactobacillus bombi TaxID=1303590 RepID=UPI0015E5A99F|nr:LysM domain-containing protein [Bombilactobacillus bombi]MBA1435078.1 LysM domain-containing protein [Bombilactobacillus bombi]